MGEADETPTRAPDRPRQEPRRDWLDESVEQTFPASDAPSWTPLHVGAPREYPDRPRPTKR